MAGINGIYHVLNQLKKIKKKELVLPIAKKEVVVYPLSVGDDLVLRTALVSPVKLDKELMKLLWDHTEIWVPNPEKNIQEETSEEPPKKSKKKEINDNSAGAYRKFSEREFYNQISYIDKLMLLWGIFNITYNTLGVQELTCPKCEAKFQQDIIIDNTLHEDSVTIFDKSVPFNQYTEEIKIPLNDDYSIIFEVGLPSMADFNRVMSLVPMEELQANLEKIRSQFNTEQLMTLYTKKLIVVKNQDPNSRVESTSPQEILSSIRDCLNIEISTEFLKQYTEKFSKYGIQFYDNSKCPQCGEIVKTAVDIEFHFFLRQLSNRT